MISVILKFISWFKKNYKLIAVGFISLLIAIIFFMYNSISKKNIEIDRLINNTRAYEQLINNNKTDNRVLQLKIQDFKQSNDSLIQELNQTKEQLKVKDKNLVSASVINTVIKDSIRTIIKPVEINFKKELKINPLTTIIVSKIDSVLEAKIDIKNSQTIIVQQKKEYKNKYKNGWCRFWHFDWKKIKYNEYKIVNSNPIIKVTNTRVIEITK